MSKKSFGLGLVAALMVALAGGCKKSPAPASPAAASSDTIARVHWLGKKRLASDKSATAFMAIWNLPESARLEAQTLDKLAVAMAGEKSEVRGQRAEGGGTNNEHRTSNIEPQNGSSPSPAQRENSSAPSPYPLPGGEGQHTNSPPLQSSNTPSPPLTGAAALIRPLLDDMVQEESYLEVRRAASRENGNSPSPAQRENSSAPSPYPVRTTQELPAGRALPQEEGGRSNNQPADFALAIRLSDERARLWETNLAVLRKETESRVRTTQELPAGRAVQSPESRVRTTQGQQSNSPSPYPVRTTQGQQSNSPSPYPLPGGEGNQKPTFNFQLSTFNRSHGWTVVGREKSALAAEMLARLQRDHTPVAAEPTNFWLRAGVDLGRIDSPMLENLSAPAGLPRISLTLIGDGQNVRTHAELEFPRPLPIQLEPWNIPTNLIHEPLIGFMAIRGIRPWVEAFKPWNDLQLGTAPNQAFFWAQSGRPSGFWGPSGPPHLHFMALPSADASNQVHTLGEFVLHDINPIIATTKLGSFQRMTNSQRLVWRGIPWFSPTLDYVDSAGNPFIIGGFFPNSLTNRPVPAGLLQQVYGPTNLVWYDWEITQACVDGLTQLAQMSRNVLGRARLTQTASLLWLHAISPKLANTVTAGNIRDATRLSVTRNSSMGFTGAELQILADWLESPAFPRGLHTLVAPPPRPIGGRQGTNAVPGQPPR